MGLNELISRKKLVKSEIIIFSNGNLRRISFTLITYDILRFRKLRKGGGAFWPGSRIRKQGYVYRIDLKFGANNGTNDTSKREKF